MCPKLVVHAVKRGATVAAALHTSFVPVVRPAGTATGKVSDGRARTILGESKSSAKLLNSEDRLEKLRAHVEEQAEVSDAEKLRADKRAAAYNVVNKMLHDADIIPLPDSLKNQKPTLRLLKELALRTQIAWNNYKLVYGIGDGRIIRWMHWFDFLHGGGPSHSALRLGEGQAPPPPVLDDDDLKVKGGGKAREEGQASAMESVPLQETQLSGGGGGLSSGISGALVTELMEL